MKKVEVTNEKNEKISLDWLVINRIKASVKRPVPWLMDKLNFSKESAYRRLRGQIHFTLDEFAILSQYIGIPTEFLNCNVPQNNTGNLPLYILEQYLNCLQTITERGGIATTQTAARRILFLPFWIESDSIFKVFCYKYMHRASGSYSAIQNSTHGIIREVRKKIIEIQNANCALSNEYIVYKNLFSLVADDVQYFYLCKLLSAEETECAKAELHSFLNRLETLMTNGCDKDGNSHTFYLSMMDIESDIVCANVDPRIHYSMQWNPENHLIAMSREDFGARRQWINAIKRYTSLITMSNEILRSDFIDRQRRIIDSIGKNPSLII
jgi:hypothetical protein